ncbi:hypothetical protein [Roseinatronobacter sp. NSM]|uniref:hypothetical protein n=1 Tax=Roseinatronobacter sp. NSM TaxID=3457785 RepID=UPI004037403B
MTAPFNLGREAALADKPHTDCPIPKPEGPAKGDNYPGDWANWMSGWILQRGYMGLDSFEACTELHAFIRAGLKLPPQHPQPK